MGNERIYSLMQVSGVFDLIIKNKLIDFKIKQIFRASPNHEALKRLKEILAEIDWKKKQIKRNSRHEEALIYQEPPDNVNNKDKDKEKENKAFDVGSLSDSMNALTLKSSEGEEVKIKELEPEQIVWHHICASIEMYNVDKNHSQQINSYTWATLCKELINNGQLFSRFSKHALAARGILFEEMLQAFRSLNLEKYSLESEKSLLEGVIPWVKVEFKLNTERPQLMILQFLGQLCRRSRLKTSAKILHNFFHFGYLVYKNEQHNGVSPESAAMLLTPAFLDAIEFSGKLTRSPASAENANLSREELLSLAQLIHIFLGSDIFKRPFDHHRTQKKYKQYCQPQELYEDKLRLCTIKIAECESTLLEAVIDRPVDFDEKDEPEDEMIKRERELQFKGKNKPKISILQRFKLFGSNRDLDEISKTPAKRSPKEEHSSSKESSPREGSPRKTSTQRSESPTKPLSTDNQVNDESENVAGVNFHQVAMTYTPGKAMANRRRSAYIKSVKKQEPSADIKTWRSWQQSPAIPVTFYPCGLAPAPKKRQHRLSQVGVEAAMTSEEEASFDSSCSEPPESPRKEQFVNLASIGESKHEADSSDILKTKRKKRAGINN